ncbi:MAG TPA: diiron oxygenase [Gammaproteobacteria bacterium]|nr:diiron oxygenase [Gammaproteobacteria bacterium]
MQILKTNQQNVDLVPSSSSLDKQKINVAQATIILNKLSRSWKNRAQVRRSMGENILFNENAEDFLVDLLPFKDHPIFCNASEDMKRKILSCGWIIYNQKTITIETDIINPTCTNILSGIIPGATNPVSKQIICETMVDESYHVLLVTNAIALTGQKRDIFLKLTLFNLVKNMKKYQEKRSSGWERILVQLATAIVSEIFISDYLKLLSENEKIQLINRFTTKAHRDDELAHSNIFKNLTKCIYANLNRKEKEFFAEFLAKPVRWFADRELDVWQIALEQIGFKNAHNMILDCKNFNSKCLMHIDYSVLVSLADELGITNMPKGQDSFYKEGLIN